MLEDTSGVIGLGMVRTVKGIYNPATVRAVEGRQPAYIWTGHMRLEVPYAIYRANGLMPNWHFFYTISGRGYFGQKKRRQEVSAGDVVLLGPDCEHDYGCLPGIHWEYVFAYFTPRPTWLEWMALPSIGRKLMRLHIPSEGARPSILAAMLRCHRYAHATFGTFADELASNALEEALLLAAHESAYVSGTDAAMSPQITAAVRHLSEFIAQTHSVPALARRAGLSPSRFAHKFKEETGESVINYLIRLRIRRAARLLEYSGLSVKEAAREVGFSSPFYFSKQFRQQYFISPSEYRKAASSMRDH
jgi:AraC family transcriptional regulator of arabinose operon